VRRVFIGFVISDECDGPRCSYMLLSVAGELLQRAVQWSTPIRNGRFTTRPGTRSVNADSPPTARAQRPKTRVLYKLALMVRLCMENKAPKYLVNCRTSIADVASRNRRSANLHRLIVPRYQRSRLGRRAFSVGVRPSGIHCLSNCVNRH